MPKVAEINDCWVCPERLLAHHKDYCAKEGYPQDSLFIDLTERLLIRWKTTGKWGDIPEWCQLPDSSELEPSTEENSLRKLLDFAKSFEVSNTLKEYIGPSKQRGHDCMMGIKMFLRHVQERIEKGDKQCDRAD